MLSESFTDDKGYKLIDYKKINIETGTSEKEIDYHSLYGLSIEDGEEINSITIRYKYLGKEFEKTVTIF